MVAIALLLGGGLTSLRPMVILKPGLPFTLVPLLLCVCIVMGLRSEHAVLKGATPAE